MADYKKPDYWQLKARKEGYPARSVYKLKEMDEKFGLLRNLRFSGKDGFKILDLGAAPGSWSLYVLRKINSQGFLCAADLMPLSRQYDNSLFDGENFLFVQGDITDDSIREMISSHGPYSLILSDAAPATTGNRSVDAARSLELCETVIDYSCRTLAHGGCLVFKIFQGGESASVLKKAKAMFSAAKTFKPQACRSESFETYFVGTGYI